MERWGNIRIFSLKEKWLYNPSDNADMSNEKGDLFRDNLLLK